MNNELLVASEQCVIFDRMFMYCKNVRTVLDSWTDVEHVYVDSWTELVSPF
jgi:hypothetical protein